MLGKRYEGSMYDGIKGEIMIESSTKTQGKYYIVSLKNTKVKDASLTLWRPDNKGYTYFLCAAGVYDEIDPEYHGSDGNIPLEINSLVRLTVRGTDVSRCIENTRENRDLIRKMWREELKEIKKKKKG